VADAFFSGEPTAADALMLFGMPVGLGFVGSVARI